MVTIGLNGGVKKVDDLTHKELVKLCKYLILTRGE
jgi:hypothetical protein